MPTLLTNPKPKRKLPPCGRRNEYHEPHSPFQKLIDGQRLRLGLTFRDLAASITIHAATLWIWLHNQNGYPHPKSFKPHHLTALARRLNLKPADIRSALDASRHLYTARETPTPHASHDALGVLIDTLENIQKRQVATQWILNLAKRLQNGTSEIADPVPRTQKVRAMRV